MYPTLKRENCQGELCANTTNIGNFTFVNYCGHIAQGSIFNDVAYVVGYRKKGFGSDGELSSFPSKKGLSKDISPYMVMFKQGLEKSHSCQNCCRGKSSS